MLDFIATQNSEGGYDLTIAGYTCLSIVMVLLLLVAVLISSRGHKKMQTRQLAFCSLALAIAFVTGTYIKLWHMPMGGSVTLCSMLFVSLIGYWYGIRTGLMAAFAYGMLQFVTNPWIVNIPQVFFDYIFAYGSLGLSGLFHNKKYGLVPGFCVGVGGRFLFSFLSGIIFFAESSAAAGAEYGMSAEIYSAVYNIAYIGTEAAMTVIILCLPPVKKVMTQIKLMAVAGQ